MATSTEQINALISGYTDLKTYFEGWQDHYESSYNDFASDVHSATNSTIYLDQVNGLDTNDGAQATPLKTMAKALTKMSWGGYITIRLIGDYQLDNQVFVRAGGMRVESADAANKSKLSFAGLDTGGSGAVARFYAIGGCYLFFVNLKVELGVADVGATSDAVISVSPITSLNCAGCEFIVLAGADQKLLGAGGGKALNIATSTYPAEMAGLWIDGVAAATDPLTQRDVATCNLATL